jgi:putative toxin-antitoxin system antitoxin component (TIGR02293 family)
MTTISIADLPYSNNLRMAEIVRSGIPARALKPFAEMLKLTISEVSTFALIPSRTVERRIASNAMLRQAEAERVVRIGRIFSKAKDVFEDADEAASWMSDRLEQFNGETPLHLCETEAGAREAEQILGRIEHGVFA